MLVLDLRKARIYCQELFPDSPHDRTGVRRVAVLTAASDEAGKVYVLRGFGWE
jgi:hypothetical protein